MPILKQMLHLRRINPKEVKHGLYECLVGDATLRIRFYRLKRPTLIFFHPMSIWWVQNELINVPSRERIISKLIDGVRDSYDFIHDCSHLVGLITVNALSADSVIIPVQAEYFA